MEQIDYHGTNKENHNLGVGRGNLKISKDIINNYKIGKYYQQFFIHYVLNFQIFYDTINMSKKFA